MIDFSLIIKYKEFFLLYLSVLIRVVSILSFIPVVNYPSYPILLKVILNIFVALWLTPLVLSAGVRIDTSYFDSPMSITLGILNEFFFGFVITLWIRFFFTAAILAGDIIGTVGGFAMAHVFDPTSGQSIIIGRFFLVMMMLLFLSGGFLELILYAVYMSFLKYPPFQCETTDSLFSLLIHKFSQSFVVGLQLAAPIVLCVLVFNVALALVARIMPQMNVFFVAIPVQLALVIIVLIVTIPYMSEIIVETFKEEITKLLTFFREN